jgi:hypothetical protein
MRAIVHAEKNRRRMNLLLGNSIQQQQHIKRGEIMKNRYKNLFKN